MIIAFESRRRNKLANMNYAFLHVTRKNNCRRTSGKTETNGSSAKTLAPLPNGRRPPPRTTMLLRRLLLSSRHFRHGLQTVAPATSASSSASSSPLPFRRLRDLLPSRVLSPRLLSTSGRDDDGNKPWSFAADSGDPDPFAQEDAAADAGEALPVGPAAVADEPWTKGFGVEGENGDVFEGIYKEAASAVPASGEAAPAGDEEQWTLSGDEKDPFADSVLGEGIDGIQREGGGLDELDGGEDPEAELKRQKNMEREKELMEILKGDH